MLPCIALVVEDDGRDFLYSRGDTDQLRICVTARTAALMRPGS